VIYSLDNLPGLSQDLFDKLSSSPALDYLGCATELFVNFQGTHAISYISAKSLFDVYICSTGTPSLLDARARAVL
jgi:hypothetical protein